MTGDRLTSLDLDVGTAFPSCQPEIVAVRRMLGEMRGVTNAELVLLFSCLSKAITASPENRPQYMPTDARAAVVAALRHFGELSASHMYAEEKDR